MQGVRGQRDKREGAVECEWRVASYSLSACERVECERVMGRRERDEGRVRGEVVNAREEVDPDVKTTTTRRGVDIRLCERTEPSKERLSV